LEGEFGGRFEKFVVGSDVRRGEEVATNTASSYL
jgi:hypothetical protein